MTSFSKPSRRALPYRNLSPKIVSLGLQALTLFEQQLFNLVSDLRDLIGYGTLLSNVLGSLEVPFQTIKFGLQGSEFFQHHNLIVRRHDDWPKDTPYTINKYTRLHNLRQDFSRFFSLRKRSVE
jgi:hypothetical protein